MSRETQNAMEPRSNGKPYRRSSPTIPTWNSKVSSSKTATGMGVRVASPPDPPVLPKTSPPPRSTTVTSRFSLPVARYTTTNQTPSPSSTVVDDDNGNGFYTDKFTKLPPDSPRGSKEDGGVNFSYQQDSGLVPVGFESHETGSRTGSRSVDTNQSSETEDVVKAKDSKTELESLDANDGAVEIVITKTVKLGKKSDLQVTKDGETANEAFDAKSGSSEDKKTKLQCSSLPETASLAQSPQALEPIRSSSKSYTRSVTIPISNSRVSYSKMSTGMGVRVASRPVREDPVLPKVSTRFSLPVPVPVPGQNHSLPETYSLAASLPPPSTTVIRQCSSIPLPETGSPSTVASSRSRTRFSLPVVVDETGQYVPSSFVSQVSILISAAIVVGALTGLAQPLHTHIIMGSAPVGSSNYQTAFTLYHQFLAKCFWVGLFGLLFLWCRLTPATLPKCLPHYTIWCFVIDEFIGVPCLLVAFCLLCWFLSPMFAIFGGVLSLMLMIERLAFMPDSCWWKRLTGWWKRGKKEEKSMV